MKLVRDKVPEIIEKSGRTCNYKIAQDGNIKALLHEKLHEEIAEFIETPSYEEAADVYEVFKALCNHHGMSMFRVELAAVSKRRDYGGFEKKFLLEDDK